MSCSIAGCDRRRLARGYCRMHYKRVRRHGDPHRGRLTAEERFWRLVDRAGEDECWPWLGAVSGGYGRFAIGPREAGNAQAHRFAFELLLGPVPADHELHHRCENRLCCNPAHLLAVTPLVHREAHGYSATHCRKGHQWTPENTIRRTDGGRRCRTCQRQYEERAYARRRGQAPKSLPEPQIGARSSA